MHHRGRQAGNFSQTPVDVTESLRLGAHLKDATSKLDSGNEREAMLLNLSLASPLTEAAGTPLASGTGPRGLGLNFLGVELHGKGHSRGRLNLEPLLAP